MESSSRGKLVNRSRVSAGSHVRGVVRVRREAQVVRSLAGGAMGHVPVSRDRAGSFLVLVVGTLALLAVITIVYVALGNQDARTRAAVAKREQLDDVPKKMSDYIADVVARDTLALTFTGEQVPDPANAANTIDGFRRETSDVPGVQWNAYSPRTATDVLPVGQFRFSVPGGLEPNPSTGVLNTPPVEIAGLDPWLAPHRPVDLNWNNASAPNDPDYLKNLDWSSITNIAPDGAFVNLFNLRELGMEVTSSQLRGLGAGTSGLSLLEPDGGSPPRARFTNTTDFGVAANPNQPAHWTNRQRLAYRPAQPAATPNALYCEDPGDENYKLYQWVDADGDGMLDSRIFELVDLANTGVPLPTFGGKYRYFFGTRIVDLSGLVNVNFAGDQVAPPSAAIAGSTPTTQVPLGLTPADIDLRRLLTLADVYANTDIDTSGAQSGAGIGFDAIHQPPGAGSPANYALYNETQAYFTGVAAYQSLRLSLASGAVMPAADYIASGGYPSLVQGANVQYTATFTPPATFPETLSDYAERTNVFPPGNWPEGQSRWKFSAWPYSTTAPTTTPAEVFSLPAQRANYYNQQAIRSFQTSADFDIANNTVGTAFSGRFGLGDLAELLTRRATNDPSVTSSLELALTGRDATAPNPADTLRYNPLRSNRGEDVERSRYDTVDPSVPNQTERDRTLLQLDSDVRSLLTTMSWSRQLRSGVYADGTNAQVDPTELSDADRKLDLRAALDLQLRDAAGNPIRTDSALAAARVFPGYASALAPYSYLDQTWQPEGVTSPDVDFQRFRTLFYGYSGADVAVMAAGHMAVNLADMGDGVAQYDTSGGAPVFTRGFTDETTPTARTLLLSGNTTAAGIRTTLNTAAVTDAIRATSFPSWVPEVAGEPTQNLALPNARLAPNATGADSPIVPAIEVYGIEPQVFISQVATYTVYGDMDATNNTTTNPFGGVQASIDTDVPGVASSSTLGTREVLYRMAAFKLVNPFDKDVVLSRDPYTDANPTLAAGTPVTSDASTVDVRTFPGRLDTAKDFHYIRFGDRTYMLMQLDQATTATGEYDGSPPGTAELPVTTIKGITVPANRTVIVYALSEPPSRVLDTLRNIPGSVVGGATADYAGTGTPVPAGNLRETIERTLLRTMGYNGEPDAANPERMRIYWVPMIAGTTTGVTESAGAFGDATSQFSDGATEPIENVQNLGNFIDVLPSAASLAPTANPTASLWRAVRQAVVPSLPLSSPSQPAEQQFSTTVPTGVTASNIAVYAPNDYTNDMLVDRFRLPGDVDQVRGVITSPAGDEFDVVGSDTATNAAIAIAAVYRSSRPLDTGVPGSTRPPLGVLPAYCIEPKYYGLTPTTSWNVAETELPPLTPTSDYEDITNYSDSSTGSYNWKFDGTGGWVDWVAVMSKSNFGGATPITTSADLVLESDPRKEVASSLTATPSPTDPGCLDIDATANITRNLFGPNAGVVPTVGGFTYDQMYPQVTFASPAFRSGDLDAAVTTPASVQSISILRLTNALQPMGIGPQRAPLNPDGSPRLSANVFGVPAYEDINHQYTTLGEALAISMGYEKFDFDIVDPLAWVEDPALRFGPYFDDGSGTLQITLPTVTTAGEDPARLLLFDRGQLALDRFVPFVDNNTATIRGFDTPATYGSLAATDDQRWGLQIPAAQAVLEQFSVPVAGREPGQERLRETLTRGTPGLININTAPVEVLRTLPLLSPRPFQYDNGGTPDWRVAFGGAGPFAADPAVWQVGAAPNWMLSFNQSWDIPAGIAAYRDQRTVLAAPSARTFAITRAVTTAPPTGLGASASYPTATDAGAFIINSADPALGGATVIDREAATGIPALSDEAGFPSVGALLSVRNPVQGEAVSTTVGANNRLPRRYPPSRGMSLAIDALGSDEPVGGTTSGANNTDPRLDPFAGSDDGAVGAGTLADPYRPANEYREKLQFASGSLNLVTNRSDLFAAYFVVLGFSEEDIRAVREANESIPPRTVPLVASVQRRFLMVIDRSTIVRTGDKPKVLLFKEVPM